MSSTASAPTANFSGRCSCPRHRSVKCAGDHVQRRSEDHDSKTSQARAEEDRGQGSPASRLRCTARLVQGVLVQGVLANASRLFAMALADTAEAALPQLFLI